MKLIVGLGNPGAQYAQTRHNIGFVLLDKLAKEWDADFQDKPKFKALVAATEVDGEKVLLIKPTTFYNLVGESVRAIRDFYKLENKDILVIHDDMALPFGTIRTRLSGSDAGNNGVKSLNQHLAEDYARIRVGVWSEYRENTPATDFVLGKLTASQQQQLLSAAETFIAPLIKEFAKTDELAHHTIKLQTED